MSDSILMFVIAIAIFPWELFGQWRRRRALSKDIAGLAQRMADQRKRWPIDGDPGGRQ